MRRSRLLAGESANDCNLTECTPSSLQLNEKNRRKKAMKKKTISVRLTKERKRWSLTIEGTHPEMLNDLTDLITQYTSNLQVKVVNLASPWAKIKPKKKKGKPVVVSASVVMDDKTPSTFTGVSNG